MTDAHRRVQNKALDGLTAQFGLNHNAIRQHLAKLVDARLAVESTASPTARRPGLRVPWG